MTSRWLVLILSVSALFRPCVSHAQRYRYMDSSGNIHFVESLKQIPSQYQRQVVPSTPTPVLDDRERKKELHRREKEYQDRQKKAEKEKNRALQRIKKDAERDQRQLKSKGSSKPQSKNNAKPDETAKSAVPEEDEIQVIR